MKRHGSSAGTNIALEMRAKLFRGLADPARLGLLLGLLSGPRSAGELARVSGVSPSNASNHLRCLLECGLVRVEAQGRRNVYSLQDPEVAELLDASERILGNGAAPLIEACRNYGPPSRRGLRTHRSNPSNPKDSGDLAAEGQTSTALPARGGR